MTSSRSPLRAVIFDWGGTLTPWHTVDVEEQWSVYARCVHEDEQRSAELAARLLTAEEAAWQRARAGGASAHMDGLLREAGLNPGEVAHEVALAAYRKFWEPHTFTDEQVRPLWQGLRERGVRVGVLSNTIWPGDYHRGVFERDGVLDLIDADVYSSEIAWTKPHPEAFLAAAAALGVEPERAAYVGDRLFEDVHGSQRAGMRAIWVPHSDIPAGQQVAVDVTPDGVAHQLLDVLRIVDRWRAEGRRGRKGRTRRPGADHDARGGTATGRAGGPGGMAGGEAAAPRRIAHRLLPGSSQTQGSHSRHEPGPATAPAAPVVA